MTKAGPGPLFFVHVPKTGGTSLIRTLRDFAPAGEAYTLPGNLLSRAFVEQLAGAMLPATAVIHGHPDWGACRPLRGRARFITVLREPRRQLISHYLHARRDPAMPQHAAANGLNLRDFLRAYPYHIVFQTRRLYLSIADREEDDRRAYADPDYGGAFQLERYFAAHLPPVFAFLEDMALAGTLEARDRFAACLADLAGWSHVPRLAHDNATPSQQRAETVLLLEQVPELEAEPELAALFAIERATYARASALLEEAERRRFRTRMQAGQATPGGYTVHQSELGEVVLGENFQPPEGQGVWGEQPSRVPASWRTGERQVSRFYVRLAGECPCRLVLRLDRLFAAIPSEILLRQGPRWLHCEVGTAADGSATLSAVLEAATDGETFIELAVYLQWNRYPDRAPFHPWVRFSAFELAPLSASGARM